MLRAGAVLTAATLDLVLGEPPARWHPVVGAGAYLGRAGQVLPAAPPGRAVVLGGAAWSAGALAAVAAGVLVARAVRRLPRPVGAMVAGTALWPLLSARMLLEEVAAVDAALGTSVAEGRRALARIVSRDTGRLDPAEVRAAAVESLAENLSDSVVAPLLWYAVAGLPGAALYRWANTADAMWGYRTARWEHAGKVAARADDLLNLVPARLTAGLLAGPRPSVLRHVRAQARRTPSPNAGWPMAALAVRLDLRLAKDGVYVLNPSGSPPRAGDVGLALPLARRAALGAVLATAVTTAVSTALTTVLTTRRHRPAAPSDPRPPGAT